MSTLEVDPHDSPLRNWLTLFVYGVLIFTAFLNFVVGDLVASLVAAMLLLNVFRVAKIGPLTVPRLTVVEWIVVAANIYVLMAYHHFPVAHTHVR